MFNLKGKRRNVKKSKKSLKKIKRLKKTRPMRIRADDDCLTS